MKQARRRTQRWTRLAALVLALTLLAGCAAPADSGGGAAGANETAETGGDDRSAETGGSGATPDPIDTDAAPSDGGGVSRDDTTLSPEEEALLTRTGFVQGGHIEISGTEADEIERAVAGRWAAYTAGPNGEDPLVKSRDWSVYASSLGQEMLSHREAEFYDRLDKLCLKYLSTSALDGIRNMGSRDENNRYKMGGVQYSDLGLSAQKAQDILTWFTYTSPQYYFLNSWAAWDMGSGTIYPCMYEFAADGEERAEITNELFDKLDGWIQEVESRAFTTYQKELYANNLICESAIYNHDALEDTEEANIAIWICQSLYSTVMLEATVCAGYSKTFTAMMNAMGVDATAGLSVNHAWNVVRLEDGNCYAVDVCWNDTDRNPPYENDYLNAGEEIMSATNSRKEAHTYEDCFAKWIPAIASESYTPADEDLRQLTAPDAPANIETTPVDEETATVTWDAVPGAAGYEVVLYQDASYQEVWNQLSRTADQLSASLINLEQGETRYLAIRTVASVNGQEAYSDWVRFSYTHTEDTASQKPAAPTNFRTVPAGGDKAQTTWDPVDGATVYDTCLYTDSTYTQVIDGCFWTDPADAGTYVNWTNMRAGTTYYLGLRAGKEVNGETVYSDWVNISYTHTEDAAP